MADSPYGKVQNIMMVPLKGYTAKYAFRTNIDRATTITALGHVSAVDANGKLIAGAVLGANSPKPPRATKLISAVVGNEGSFIDHTKIAAAKADGWLVQAGKIRVPTSTALSKAVFVTSSSGTDPDVITIKYAWMMPEYQYTAIGATDLAGLGIEAVTDANFGEVLFGINTPKPKRAVKKLDTGGSIKTFVSKAKEDALPTGWKLRGIRGGLPFGV